MSEQPFFREKIINKTKVFYFFDIIKNILINASEFHFGSKIFEKYVCDTGPNEH